MNETKYKPLEVSSSSQNNFYDNNETEFLEEEINIELGKKNKLHSQIYHTSLVTLLLIVIYFTLSIGLTFYQQKLVAELKFPLTIVLIHFYIKFFMAGLIRLGYRLKTRKSRILLDFRTWLTTLAPPGLASGIDIGFSNWGLELVNISLYTMTKSTTIIFILIFAIMLGLEKKSYSLILIVAMISSGLCLVTYKSTSFDARGFIFLLIASLSSGVRWTFSQMIMQKTKIGLHNPIDMVFHMQPWMIISILPSTMIFEGSRLLNVFHNTLPNMSSADIIGLCVKISGGAVIAFAMELSEFLLICRTSSLTVSVTGIFKEICQIILAVFINNDQLSLINVIGLLLCLGGIVCHVYHKFTEMSKHTLADDGDNSVAFIRSPSSGSNGAKPVSNAYKRSVQNLPLLDADSDSDESQNENENSSEVIFDVLKRRDERR